MTTNNKAEIIMRYYDMKRTFDDIIMDNKKISNELNHLEAKLALIQSDDMFVHEYEVGQVTANIDELKQQAFQTTNFAKIIFKQIKSMEEEMANF